MKHWRTPREPRERQALKAGSYFPRTTEGTTACAQENSGISEPAAQRYSIHGRPNHPLLSMKPALLQSLPTPLRLPLPADQ